MNAKGKKKKERRKGTAETRKRASGEENAKEARRTRLALLEKSEWQEP